MIPLTEKQKSWFYGFVFFGSAVLAILVLALLFNIRERKREAEERYLKVVEVGHEEIDPAVWGRNFPLEYERFAMTQIDGHKTPYGGSDPYDKLKRYPVMRRLWAGYSFSQDHKEERGHHYAAIDQALTLRTQLVKQPGACVNCHAAQAPLLIDRFGWEAFNRMPYDSLKPQLTMGSSCADCHDPQTMELRITRPAFRQAMATLGVDLSRVTRQEMRSYVCGQCHVEYYFRGPDHILTFPWHRGLRIDSIEAHYEAYGFTDWVHAETGGGMIKVQHPEFELWSTGIHARSGVSCADCHMPYIRRGSVKISDHWIRSPLQDVEASCRTCHPFPREELEARILSIQDQTARLLRITEQALVDAIDAIVVARSRGVSEVALDEARRLHRSAQIRWDFVSSENSTGFHSPQEAARILAEAIDRARKAQLVVLATGR